MSSNQSCIWFCDSPAYQVSIFQGQCDSRAVHQAGRIYEVAADRSSPCSNFFAHCDHRTPLIQQQRAVTAVQTCLRHLSRCVSQASSALQSPHSALQSPLASFSAHIQADSRKRKATCQQTADTTSGELHSNEPSSRTPGSRSSGRGRKPERRRSGSCTEGFASASSGAGSGEWKLPSFLQWKQWKPPRYDP